MSFEQALAAAAVATGPLGIWAGWWLSERSTSRREASQRSDVAETEELERVLEVARLARLLAGHSRSLGHGLFLKKTRREPTGFQDMVEGFNAVREEFRLLVLRLRVLGPTWAVGPAEQLELRGQQMTELLGQMELRFSGTQVDRLQVELPKMDEEVDAFVALLSQRYNDSHDSLPRRPDLEAEGRFE